MRLPSYVRCGVAFVAGNELDYLPLELVTVHADVLDASAIVTVTQQYYHARPTQAIRPAQYSFPLPASAAICAFELVTGDGVVINAVAKEIEEAWQEHQAALARGQSTALVEYSTDDIFTISVGQLPPDQTITTRVTYVVDLMDADVADQVRLQLPMCIGHRYGAAPESMLRSRKVPANRVSISVDIYMSNTIQSITSPTHPTMTVSRGGIRAPPNRRMAQYLSRDYLEQDFVLSIVGDNLDAPRCFAQRGNNGIIAMQLTFVPKIDNILIPRQEYVFVIDRSGSMEGTRIETAKQALVMLLRALPAEGTMFNIFSFGSHFDSLWSRSLPYSEENLRRATEYVDGMTANYGGTEMANTLAGVLGSRNKEMPTACILLTDGETYIIDNILARVSDAVKQAPREAPLRMFTLGIGSTVSSATCQGIARVGNGICLMATTSESIIGKCSKLVRASRSNVMKDVDIDWGSRAPRTPLPPMAPFVATPTGILQSPDELKGFYPGARCTVFALVKESEKFKIPNQVTICTASGTQGPTSIKVPVIQIQSSAPTYSRLIQTLAAQQLVYDIQNTPDAEQHITRLGIHYGIVTSRTSFIAVDRRSEKVVGVQHSSDFDDVYYGSQEEYGPRPILRRHTWVPSPSTAPHVRAAALLGGGASGDAPVRHKKARSIIALPTLSLPKLRMPAFKSAFSNKSPTPTTTSTPRNAPVLSLSFDPHVTTAPHPSSSISAPSLDSVDQKVVQLVRLQSFDGSFPPVTPLESIVAFGSLSEADKLGVESRVWATVLAIVYLKKHLIGHPELRDSLVEKAMQYVSKNHKVDLDALERHAQALVV